VELGDWAVGDDDDVIVPRAITEDVVLAEAERKSATESGIRAAVLDGMPPLDTRATRDVLS
jgi:regulator of RNase E activity RraA